MAFRLAITPDETWEKMIKRFARIRSRFKAYNYAAMKDIAVSLKMFWRESLRTGYQDSSLAPLSDKYEAWKAKHGFSVPKKGYLTGAYSRAIEVVPGTGNVMFQVRIDPDAMGEKSHWGKKKTVENVLYYALALEYGSKATYRRKAQPPRPFFFNTMMDWMSLYDTMMADKYGTGWLSKIEFGNL
jgi:hypothetical protein